ncbi:hypothetical protein Tco_1145705 [Tanacetum coccineum]
MDEGFIATAYPEVQENLKLTVDEQMIPEEPCSYTGTLSSLQHLTKDFSYGDQFIDDKPGRKSSSGRRLGKQGSRINKLETIGLTQNDQRADGGLDMKETMLQRMLEENYDKGHADHRVAYEALQVSIRRDECEDFDVDKARRKLRRKVSKILQRLCLGRHLHHHLLLYHRQAHQGLLANRKPRFAQAPPPQAYVLATHYADQFNKHRGPKFLKDSCFS